MQEFLKTFEDLWIAITFAEAGEHDASREYLDQQICLEESPETFTAI